MCYNGNSSPRQKVKKILENPLVLLAYSCIFALFNTSLAFFLTRHGIFTYGSLWFQFGASVNACVMLSLLPILLIRYIFKKPLATFGLRLPENAGTALTLSGTAFLICLPILYTFAHQPAFQSHYATAPDINAFIILTIISALYYLAEEFFFRGFLQGSLWQKFGYHTYWIIAAIFAILHFGKPIPEVIFAIFFSLAMSYLSQKTKSVFPAAAVHFAIALFLNILVTFVYPPLVSTGFHF